VEQPFERLFVGIVILSVREVRDEVLPDLAGAVDPLVCVEQRPVLEAVERDQLDREEPLALLLVLAGAGVGDFGFTQLLFMLTSDRIKRSVSYINIASSLVSERLRCK